MLAATAGIQSRWLCNVIDGLIAIKGGRQSAVGTLYNEFLGCIAPIRCCWVAVT